ncbi:hypothetical protein CGH85_22675 [Vibrio parahaemolyticus]|uniref:HNH endonuclease n=1 Tax=Vibrio parahaemolyticus TaxID=670 RepID=UPI00111D9F66|nr:HNH endonuclease [Vibrio parahaemolyticus]EGQ9248932.1 hypothetical protein [Vibrio parahaemolyticus]EJU9841276.1 HNH endonuclease [Vibrio parahaemolyticus]EKO5219201.1 HNH endonuclease [Vibrio parahaemolyticus]ELB2269324.1 HNH endonuclease [Vibrio parahaemolyticus]MBM5079337.1 HNH endonuclease [Vibrio parahaemolyticus]
MFNPTLITKPFPSYRWQWATDTLSERLNEPAIFFGCLEALYKNTGNKLASVELYKSLLKVESDLGLEKGELSLKENELDRNLFRRYGQYWRNLGLIQATRSGIKLTRFGEAYASGAITRSEFACQVIKSLSFPNKFRGKSKNNRPEEWLANDLSIKPLEYILEMLVALTSNETGEGYLTARELTRLVIPLAGNHYSPQDTLKLLREFRVDNSVMDGAWDAESKENDTRIAREFLLFLHYYGFLDTSATDDSNNPDQKFYLDYTNIDVVKALLDIDFELLSQDSDPVTSSIELDKKVNLADVLRDRKMIEVLSRPNQAKFRKDVLAAGGSTCLLSGVTTPDVIQACHIIQVKDGGSDDVGNGLLLRADLHTLYDKGHIRILENGEVELSSYLQEAPFYGDTLPNRIELPEYIDLEALRLRNTYNIY